jgi:hypothetical protein
MKQCLIPNLIPPFIAKPGKRSKKSLFRRKEKLKVLINEKIYSDSGFKFVVVQ